MRLGLAGRVLLLLFMGLPAVLVAAPFAYVPNEKSGTVSAIDSATNTVLATIEVGKRPWNMAVTLDGRHLYAANGRSASVSVIDVVTLVTLADVPVGEFPWGVVVP